MIYKTFEEWKAGQWLEDGEPRTEAYTEDELLLIEMGWKYGFDAGKKQTKQGEPVAWMHKKSGLLGNTRLGDADDFIPLYTTPQTKPLSDEEIKEVIRSHWNGELGNRGMLSLCKAVLKKASKKCG